MGFAELLHDLGSHLKVLQQVISHGIADPRGPLGRPELQQLVPSLLIGVNMTTSVQRNSISDLFILIYGGLRIQTWTSCPRCKNCEGVRILHAGLQNSKRILMS